MNDMVSSLIIELNEWYGILINYDTLDGLWKILNFKLSIVMKALKACDKLLNKHKKPKWKMSKSIKALNTSILSWKSNIFHDIAI